MSETEHLSERDRVATELQYVTRSYDWSAKSECLGAIVGWHLDAIAAARAEAWITGSAEPTEPAIEQMLIRCQRAHFTRIVQRLREENTGLKIRLLAACGCIEFYAGGSADAGDRAGRALKSLLCERAAAASQPTSAANLQFLPVRGNLV
jgi:hypothetical protein